MIVGTHSVLSSIDKTIIHSAQDHLCKKIQPCWTVSRPTHEHERGSMEVASFRARHRNMSS